MVIPTLTNMINAKINIQSLIDDLTSIANNLEEMGSSATGPYELFVFVTKLKTTNMTIKCFWCPESIRIRIKKLKLMSIMKFPNSTNLKPHSLKRPKYSQRIAKTFLDDGEINNYKAYRALYDLRK